MGFERRGPGTDAERRAGRWLAAELADGGREVRIESFWCRPNWALAHAWHAALALTGSLVSIYSPRVGAALLLATLLSLIADALLGVSPGRRLTWERASQNVIAIMRTEDQQLAGPVRLIVTANYDAGRTGLVYRGPLRTASARLRRLTGGMAPGWLGWLAIATAWLLAIAILRLEGDHARVLGIVQLPPTVALVLAVALLLELAAAAYAPAAGDNGSGTAVAVALVRALDAAPPRNLAVELVLQGAGEGGGIGLRRYLRARRGRLRAANTVVLGIAACSVGRPRWWLSDGALLPLRYSARLRDLCVGISRHEPQLGLAAHRGRGATPALPARAARLPAIAIGCLDGRELVPRSHQPSDRTETLDPAAVDAAVELGLILVDAIDAFVARTYSRSIPTPA
jgi:hypothetical protein